MSQSQPAVCASPIRLATTKRQRVRRTRLSGRFHVIAENTRAPGPVRMVTGQKIRETSGTASAIES